jgi:amino acid adenylation domain-containing protein
MQAGQAPHAVAVSCAGESLTYDELNARANRLARRLRALGVGPEALVGLCAGRSPAMVVGLLAVLKAGGAYIPLDPAYPPERLAFMLGDARAPVLITEHRLDVLLPDTGATIVYLDGDPTETASESDGNLSGGAGLDNLAYVIYTSGSTGWPKGAMINHRGLANYLAWATRAYAVREGEGAPVHSSIAFDLTVTSLLAPLAAGRRVDLLDEDLGIEQLAAALREPRDYSLVKITPAHLRALADQLGADRLAGRTRAFIIGGEPLTAEHVAAWREHAPETELINEYGPTETVVGCCVYRVPRGGPIAGAIPIGRPIAHTRLYVLNPSLQPVPAGVAGELYIGGAGVARGYLNRPGLTAERFIPDPHSGEPGARLYRTGDLARWRPDGNLEYLGRVDHQVKIRGYRVEPGEVEEVLSRHPAVREAVVVASAYGPDDVRLVAYVTALPDVEVPSAAELKQHLKASLPEPMIPSAFVALERLPLTPNGKVDRAALPAPESDRSSTEAAFVPPRGPVEEMLASLWAAVLGVDRIGASDDFFDLGGHSLLATQVVSRIRDAFGVALPLGDFFEDPTLAAVASQIEELMRAEAGPEIPPLRPVEPDGPIPASFSQQSLWFLDQLSPGQSTFNVTLAGRIRGPLDRDVLERSFAEIVRRHGTLRTTFDSIDGQPIQVVAPQLALPLTTIDPRTLDEPAREAEARRLAVEESRRPFDLARGPLARLVVLVLGDDDHAVLLTMHHIISDGWSLVVAARELVALYDALGRGDPSPLAPLPIQYTDYGLWQRQLLESEAGGWLVGYWSRQLAGATPLELPTDRPRPPIRTARGDFLPFAIPAELTSTLHALCRQAGVTPFMLFLGAFQSLLHRYSGQDDIVVGSPIANRNRSEVEGLIGYFINMLALRTDLSGDPSFLQLLQRVREVALAAYEHQDLPLEKVIEAVRPPRDPSRTALFQVMFVLQNNEVPDISHPSLSLEGLELDEGTGTAKFDLTLALGESDEGFFGGFEYNTDLFDRETIVRLTRHFQALLRGIITDPEDRLSALPLVDDEERHQILANGAGPPLEPQGTGLIHRLFELQVERTPDAVAVESEGRALTYRQLNDRANRLARELRERCVGPDVLVGVGLARSPDLAVALLGVLKAGGAFVPLDPDYPSERLATMLEDSRASVLLTQESLQDRWPEAQAVVIRLDADWESICRHDAANLDRGATPEDTAYVIYTSGSTGEPRGVVVRHGGLVNHNLAMASLFELSPEDRVLQFSSLSFDIAIEELFPTWIRGATVVFRDEQAQLSPSEFSEWVARKRITVLDLPTVYWHAWVEGLAGLRLRLPDSLRLVIVGGEKASARRYADWCSIGGDRIRWINTYGPTEATVVATAFEPPGGSQAGTALPELPIGRPIAHTRVYLLDGHMEQVPLGLPGELYIGGENLARCYLHRAGLTAERFVPDPFSDRPGARLFRTGDRARWRPDGQLEYLGRVDYQVKIRGFRVEPGEIEAVLRRHPGVGEALVVAREDAAGLRRLAAYVVPRDSAEPEAAELRRWVQSALPEYMVPSAFVILEALPLTPTGKLDRRALPHPGPGQLESSSEYVAPRNPLEETLARIWAEVLELERVGVHDNFFDLGGHSLQSVQLVSRLTAALNRPVAVKTVFQAPTIAAMAEILEREATASDPKSHADGDGIANLARWLLETAPPALPEHVSIERRPFLSLFAAGELAPVDAVAVGYLPTDLLHALGLDRSTVIYDWCGNRPVITDIRETPLGRIGEITIPRFNDQLYLDRADLLAVLGDAVRLAHEVGAGVVSLTGLLPSATDYGRDLVEALAGRDLPRITTGHATTTSAVVLAVRRALEEAGRDLAGEHVGFIGLGSVGIATLRLLLSCLPHPERLSLCDIYSKREALESLRQELVDELGYRGEIRLLSSGQAVPDEFYEACLIVGATNVADILDINRVAPGTVVVDDSAPHCFRPDQAIRRIEERGDILVNEGGVLLAPEPLPLRAYVPDEIEAWLQAGLVQLIAGTNTRLITGCVLSGLLSAKFEHLTPTIGLVDRRTALNHYETLDALGYQAPELQLGGTPIDERTIHAFRSRFGRVGVPASAGIRSKIPPGGGTPTETPETRHQWP